MLPPAVTGKLKAVPRADHMLLEKEMNRMFLGSATPYLPL